jgi:hypothetical protein
MSLPRILGITPENVPDAAGYIAAPTTIPDALQIPATAVPLIGIVWAGSPDNKIDRQRTIDATRFAELMAGVDAAFVNLQVGPRANDLLGDGSDCVIFGCDGVVADFHDTAAIVAQLDLVIGVDTAVMHLAAALAKPAWLLLPMMPDYRWLLGRADSPWYNSVRLFRQEQRGDWNQVFADVAAALTVWLSSPR